MGRWKQNPRAGRSLGNVSCIPSALGPHLNSQSPQEFTTLKTSKINASFVLETHSSG